MGVASDQWRGSIQELLVFVGGVRWTPMPSLVLKLQYLHSIKLAPIASVGLDDDFSILQSQNSWAF